MFGSMILDTVIALVLIYLLLSLICTAFNEWIAQLLNLRARNLADGIGNLLADPDARGLARELYAHPLIKSLYREGGKPSYIPARTFALALMDILSLSRAADELTNFEARTENLENPQIKTVLRVFIERTGDDIQKLQVEVETWFNDAMDRVAGWYKRKTQIVTLVVASSIAVLTNADTVMIANRLSQDTALRSALVAQAELMVKQPAASTGIVPSSVTPPQGDSGALDTERPPPGSAPLNDIRQNLEALRRLGLPIGWSGKSADPEELPERRDPRDFPAGPVEWFDKFLGLLVTTLAISMGAPFWFDLLNKFVNIRSSGKSPASRQGA